MHRIVIESGPLLGQVFPLSEAAQRIRIGRGNDCTIQLPDRNASRLHCVLLWDGGRWVIQDCESRNRTYVGGAVVTRQPLEPGDVIQVGVTRMTFREAETDPLVGAELGGYRLEARIGQGGMGVVYRAVQISLNRRVALKVLSGRLSGDDGFIRRFLDEAYAAARLNHPKVVLVYDAGHADGRHYIAMEYLPGGTLEELLQREGRLDPPRAVAMAMDAAEALAYAERQGIVHRDIKPSNLLIGEDEVFKLGDLGIAWDLSRSDSPFEGKAMGSPLYAAPEQVLAGTPDHRADIYALGATLYHALSGIPPFPGLSPQKVLAAKLKRDPVPLAERAPDASGVLCGVVARMMARAPDDRYANADELLEALSWASRSPTATPRRRAHAHADGKGPPQREARQPWIVAGVIAAVLILGLGLAALVVMGPAWRPPVTSPEGRPVGPTEGPSSAKKWKTALGSLRETVENLLKQDCYRDANDRVAEFKLDHPEAADQLRKMEVRIADGAATCLERLRRLVESLVEQNDFGRAKGEIDDLEAKLLEDQRAPMESLRTWVQKKKEGELGASRAVTELLLKTRSAVARLDFPLARRHLEEFEKKHPDLRKRAAPPREEVTLAGAAWAAIRKALQARREAREVLHMGFVRPDPGLRRGFRISELSGDVMRLETAGDGGNRTRAVLSLDAGSLVHLVAPATPDLRQGIGLLLLLRRGPERAREVLLDPTLGGRRRAANRGRLESAADLYLEARRQAAEKRLEEYRSSPTPPDRWEFLEGDVRELITRWRVRPKYREARRVLSRLYVGARRETIDPKRLFHDRERGIEFSPAGARVTLVYDFSFQSQLEDFVPVKEQACSKTWMEQENRLAMTGEFRILEGNPFRRRLAVKMKVERFDPEVPNINVAIWTHAGDIVTAGMDGRAFSPEQWIRGDGEEPSDTIIFGIGYRPPFDLPKEADLFKGSLPKYTESRASVILAGRHGETLHRDRRELVWEAESGDIPGGMMECEIDFREGELGSCRLGDLVVSGSILDRNQRDRLKAKAPHSGSVTFFTNGRRVEYSSIEIEAEIDPEWMEMGLESLAMEEFRRMEEGTPGR